jgi:hypothetical protein
MRRNAPRLNDPGRDVQDFTEVRLGIELPMEHPDRLSELERQVADQFRQIQQLRSLIQPSDLTDVQMIGADVVIGQFAQLIAVEENPNPGLTIGSAAGTGGSAAVSFPRGGSDTAGQIRVVCGTSGLGTGTLVTFTFNKAKADTNYIVLFAEMSSAARAVNLSISTLGTSSFPILANTAPTSGNQIDIGYLVIEVPVW